MSAPTFTDSGLRSYNFCHSYYRYLNFYYFITFSLLCDPNKLIYFISFYFILYALKYMFSSLKKMPQLSIGALSPQQTHWSLHAAIRVTKSLNIYCMYLEWYMFLLLCGLVVTNHLVTQFELQVVLKLHPLPLYIVLALHQIILCSLPLSYRLQC